MSEKDCNRFCICEGNMNHLGLVYTILSECYENEIFDGKKYSPDRMPWQNIEELREGLTNKKDRMINMGVFLPEGVENKKNLENITGLNESWIISVALGYKWEEYFPIKKSKPYYLLAGKREGYMGRRFMERFIEDIVERLERRYTHVFSRARFNSAVYHGMTNLGFIDPNPLDFSRLKREMEHIITIDEEFEDPMSSILVREI